MSQTFGPYSAAKQAGDFLFVAGQVGVNPETKQVASDVSEQTHQVLKNMQRVLEEHGSSLEQVVKTTIYLKNRDDFAAVNEVYAEYFNGSKPARATVEVARLPKVADEELLVEVEAVAYTPKDTK